MTVASRQRSLVNFKHINHSIIGKQTWGCGIFYNSLSLLVKPAWFDITESSSSLLQLFLMRFVQYIIVGVVSDTYSWEQWTDSKTALQEAYWLIPNVQIWRGVIVIVFIYTVSCHLYGKGILETLVISLYIMPIPIMWH